MAFGMKHWFGLTAAGMVMVSVWHLPPEAFPPRPTHERLPEAVRAEGLRNEISRADRILQRVRWSDSLSVYTVTNAVDGFAVGYPSGVPREQYYDHYAATGEYLEGVLIVNFSHDGQARFEEAARREIASLDRRADVLLGYYFVDGVSGSVLGRYGNDGGFDTYVGEVDGQAYCMRVAMSGGFGDGILVRASRGDGPYGPREGANTLSYCRQFLRHGLPGEYITDWLGGVGLDYAAAGTTEPDPTEPWFSRGRHTYFGVKGGLSNYSWRDRKIEVDQCLAGMVDGCLAVFTGARTMGATQASAYRADRSPAIRVGDTNWGTAPFGPWGDHILSDLEEEFGSDAFHSFWASDEPVEIAFQDAFGMDAGDWMVGWVHTYLVVSPPGPRLTKSAALGGMLAVSFFAALAGAWARRRRVA